ncbi:MAG: hypothetical protein CM15mP83_5120 [Flavobacteriaceae bacterium]|nr:MAG: hypothetical protein CM15mP83_5120 [Flavobacteriaceae bacterium]
MFWNVHVSFRFFSLIPINNRGFWENIQYGIGSMDAFPWVLFFGLLGGFGGNNGVSINPARDLGPRIIYTFLRVKKQSQTGPILGSVTAQSSGDFAGVFKILNVV